MKRERCISRGERIANGGRGGDPHGERRPGVVETVEHTEIRNAATVVLLRDRASEPKILVGQRGRRAVFMPNKFVFPGGAVERSDARLPLVGRPCDACLRRLARRSDPSLVDMLLLCAVREVWEETGIRLARRGPAGSTALPDDWQSFCDGGYLPSAEELVFFYRAITPPGRTRRFDARFFLANLDLVALASDPDDFSRASDELSHLHWIPLASAQRLDMPSITRLVLATLEKLLRQDGPPASVPFRFSENGVRKIVQI